MPATTSWRTTIPAFGYGTNPAYCENEVAFGITGCVTNPSFTVGSNALGTLLLEHFDGDTDKTIAFIGEDNDAARGGIALLTASAEDKGYEVVYGEAVLPAPPEVLPGPARGASDRHDPVLGGQRVRYRSLEQLDRASRIRHQVGRAEQIQRSASQ